MFYRHLLHHIGIEYAILLQIMGDGVLGQKRRLQADFGANPFAFGIRLIRTVITTPTAAELRTEFRALNLIELFDLAPSLVTDSSRHIDFQSYDRHTKLNC